MPSCRQARCAAVLACLLTLFSLPHVPARAATTPAASLAVYSVPGGYGTGTSVADSRTDRTFVDRDGQIAVIDTATGIVIRTVRVGRGNSRIFVDEQRERLLVYNDGAGTSENGTPDTTPTLTTLNATTDGVIRTLTLQDTLVFGGIKRPHVEKERRCNLAPPTA